MRSTRLLLGLGSAAVAAGVGAVAAKSGAGRKPASPQPRMRGNGAQPSRTTAATAGASSSLPAQSLGSVTWPGWQLPQPSLPTAAQTSVALGQAEELRRQPSPWRALGETFASVTLLTTALSPVVNFFENRATEQVLGRARSSMPVAARRALWTTAGVGAVRGLVFGTQGAVIQACENGTGNEAGVWVRSVAAAGSAGWETLLATPLIGARNLAVRKDVSGAQAWRERWATSPGLSVVERVQVRTRALCPGLVATGFWDVSWFATAAASQRVLQPLLEPLNRMALEHLKQRGLKRDSSVRELGGWVVVAWWCNDSGAPKGTGNLAAAVATFVTNPLDVWGQIRRSGGDPVAMFRERGMRLAFAGVWKKLPLQQLSLGVVMSLYPWVRQALFGPTADRVE